MANIKPVYLMVALSFSSSFFTIARAQTLNDTLKQADQGFQQQITALQQQVNDANSAMNQCNIQYQAGADGKANPDLAPVPGSDEKTAGMLQALLPAVTQLGPALPSIMDSLKGADSEAEKNKTRAIDDYNIELDRFASDWGTKQITPNKSGVKSGIGEQRETDPKKISASKVSVRKKALSFCDTLNPNAPSATGTSSDTAHMLNINACQRDANNLADSFAEMLSKLEVAKNTNIASSALAGAAITAATAGFMAMKQHDSAVTQTTQQNEIAQRAADNGLTACKADAQNQINNAKRALAQTESDRADALRDLALRNAAELNKNNNSNGVTVNSDLAKLPAINPGSPDGTVKPTTDPKVADNGAPAGGGAAGGSPGAGSGGGGGTPDWGFGGGGNGNYLGGGLPAQEGGAQFAASGGGGIFDGGFGEDGGGDLSLDGSTGAGGAERGLASVSGIGDGGLNVLMARMRLRFAYHAADLMQGVDLKSLAQKSESKPQNAKPQERMPASKL